MGRKGRSSQKGNSKITLARSESLCLKVNQVSDGNSMKNGPGSGTV